MTRTTATLTVTLGSIAYTGQAEFTIIPGEKAVMYYPDGSGYPGSPAQIDDVSFTTEEVEFIGPDCDEPWAYRTREELGVGAEIADRWVSDELNTGSHDDELFADADYDDYDY